MPIADHSDIHVYTHPLILVREAAARIPGVSDVTVTGDGLPWPRVMWLTYKGSPSEASVFDALNGPNGTPCVRPSGCDLRIKRV